MISALCFVQVAPGKVNEVGQAMAEIKGVRSVYSVTGKIDMVALIEVVDHDRVADVACIAFVHEVAQPHDQDGLPLGDVAVGGVEAGLVVLARCRGER